MDTNQARDLLGQHWSTFVGAVFDPAVRSVPGGVQQYVWQGLTNYYASRGEPLPKGSFQAVNRLLSLAGQQRAAQLNLAQALDTFSRSKVEQYISPAHISPAIDATLPSAGAFGNQYRLIYQNHYILNGQEVTQIETHDLGYDLPQSLTQLTATTEMAAAMQAQDYEYEWAGVATPLGIQSY